MVILRFHLDMIVEVIGSRQWTKKAFHCKITGVEEIEEQLCIQDKEFARFFHYYEKRRVTCIKIRG